MRLGNGRRAEAAEEAEEAEEAGSASRKGDVEAGE